MFLQFSSNSVQFSVKLNIFFSEHEIIDFRDMLKSQTNTIDISEVQKCLLVAGFWECACLFGGCS